MRICLIGGAGYIGSTVTKALVGAGLDVSVVDCFLYYPAIAKSRRADERMTVHDGDFRSAEVLKIALADADAVVHLGGFVGEPACDLDPALTVQTNYGAPVHAARIASDMGVGRYIFLSTCSVYGEQQGIVSEQTEPSPLSLYAETKLQAELELRHTWPGTFVALRLGTVFGLSDRMRFDSVVNSMTARAVTTGQIPLRGGGNWRPLLHIDDLADLVRTLVLSLPSGGAEVFNVGSPGANYRVEQIAVTVAECVDGSVIVREDAAADPRDYKVTFEALEAAYPGVCQRTLEQGIDEIAAAVRTGKFGNPQVPEYDNLAGLKAALAAGRIAASDDAGIVSASATFERNRRV